MHVMTKLKTMNKREEKQNNKKIENAQRMDCPTTVENVILINSSVRITS